jgi:predicted RNA-binding Zn ribbon-like protein
MHALHPLGMMPRRGTAAQWQVAFVTISPRYRRGVDAPLLGEDLPVELMNTIWADRAGVHDALDGPTGALAWLRAVGSRLDPGPAGLAGWLAHAHPAGLGETADGLRAVRDALRRLAAEVTADPRDVATPTTGTRAAALAALAQASAAAPTWSALHWPDGGEPVRSVHTAGPAGPAATSMLAEQGIALFAGPRRGVLRACLAPGCVLYFLREHPRRGWCSAACGNRARVARHYERRRGS